MRRLCSLFAAGFIGFIPMSAWAIPSVSFDISDADIRVGETFTVDVVVDGVDLSDEVLAFGFDVGFDVAWSETLAPVIGPAFDFNDSALFPNTDVAGSMGLNMGPNGDDILLATLSFASTAPGLFDLGIVSDLFDPNEGLFTLVDTYDLTHLETVRVNAAASGVPEPASAFLLALGLVGIGYQRRKNAKTGYLHQ